MTGAEPEPWTDLDTLAWGKVQAWNLGGNLETEIFRMLADARLGDPARTDDLLTLREGGPVITPSVDRRAAARRRPSATATARAGAPSPALERRPGARLALDRRRWPGRRCAAAGLDDGDALASDHGIGSNDWVVGPSLSASGGALLANDPHLGIAMPSIWFINGLHCATVGDACPYDVAGVSFPGVPGVVLGHNARIAWGATNVDPDVQDLVIETIDPADPTRYLAPDGTLAAVHRPDRDDRGRRRRHRSPSRSARPSTARSSTTSTRGSPTRPPMALRWTGIHPSAGPDGTLDAVLALNVADDFDDVPRGPVDLRRARRRTSSTPTSTATSATSCPGGSRSAPIRRTAGCDRSAATTAAASGPATSRTTTCPASSTPADGLIVTANNAAVDEAWPDFIGAEWDPGLPRRADHRPHRRRTARDGLTLDEMSADPDRHGAAAGRDVVSCAWTRWTASTPDGEAVADAIADWDGACPMDSLGCAAYMTWEYHVLRAHVRRRARRRWPATTSAARGRWTALERLLDEPAGAVVGDARRRTSRSLSRCSRRSIAPGPTCGRPSATRRPGAGASSTRRPSQEQTVGNSGIGPLESYMNRGPVGRARRGGRRQQHLLPVLARLPRSAGPRVRAGRPRPAVHGHQPAVVPAAHRHGRPRRRADRHHDRPIGQPVRRPLRRPDRAVADRPDAALPVQPLRPSRRRPCRP